MGHLTFYPGVTISSSGVENYSKLAIIGSVTDYSTGNADLDSLLNKNKLVWKLFYGGNKFSIDGQSHFYLILSSALPIQGYPSAYDSKGTKLDIYPTETITNRCMGWC